MAGNKYIVDWDTITRFVTEAFEKYGIPEEDAKICTDVLLESDRRGIESHGVNRFKPIYLDRIKSGVQKAVTNFEIVKETETTAVVDGHDGMGQVIGYKSMQMAIEKAKKYGMGMVVVRNSCHYGIAGYYTSMATKAGCIGMTGTNARPSVAPTWGTEGMFGTNPFTLGVPTDEPFDFNFDCATSITQNGKFEYYERIGEEVHPGTVIGEDGEPVTGDAGVALKRIRQNPRRWSPWAASARRWADTRATASPCSWSSCAPCCRTAISESSSTAWTRTATSALPAWATSSSPSTPTTSWARSSAARRAGDIIRGVRASRRMPGADRIYTAGEKEYEIRLARKDGVPINESVQHEISQIRDELGLTEYVFPWEK